MTHFAQGCAEGPNRLHEALEAALKSPLLTVAGKGSALKEVSTLLLLLSGPADLSFAEVQRAVSELERMAGDRCQVRVGVHAVETQSSRLELFLLASSGEPPRKVAAVKLSTPAPVSVPEQKEASVVPEKSTVPARDAKETRNTKLTKAAALQQTQGVLNLEAYQRGRFDKSEPTIVEGEDLDIPTFLRKGIKLGSPFRH